MLADEVDGRARAQSEVVSQQARQRDIRGGHFGMWQRRAFVMPLLEVRTGDGRWSHSNQCRRCRGAPLRRGRDMRRRLVSDGVWFFCVVIDVVCRKKKRERYVLLKLLCCLEIPWDFLKWETLDNPRRTVMHQLLSLILTRKRSSWKLS